MTRSEDKVLARAHLLSLLFRATDEQLDGFARRVGLAHPLGSERLRLARHILEGVALALEEDGDDRWKRLEAAARSLVDDESPGAAERTEPSAPALSKSVESRVAVSPVSPVPSAPRLDNLPSAPKRHIPSPPVAGSQVAAPSRWAAPPDPPPASGAVDETIAGSLTAASSGSLPFRGSGPAPPRRIDPEAVHPDTGETCFITQLGDVDSTTPFGIEASAPLSLESYAAIGVELELAGDHDRALVLRHYGIADDAEWHAIEQAMGRYLRRQPDERRRVEQLRQGYLQYRRGMP